MKAPSDRLFTIPNVLSIIRICLTPLFVIFIFTERYTAGLVFIIVAGLSDTLDGQIARRFGQESRFGQIIDPMADKFFGVCAFVTFSLVGLMPAWLGALVFTRDIAISLGVGILLLLNMEAIAKPSVWGKANTAFQIATIIIVILGTFEPLMPYLHGYHIIDFFLYTLASLTAISGTDYLAKTIKEYEEGLLVKTPGD